MWSTSDPVSRLGLAIAVILVAAKVGGDLAVRARQPSVLGELVGGILLGSLPLSFLRELRTDAGVDMLARIGVLVLLFEVGLDSTVRAVGLSLCFVLAWAADLIGLAPIVGAFGAGLALRWRLGRIQPSALDGSSTGPSRQPGVK